MKRSSLPTKLPTQAAPSETPPAVTSDESTVPEWAQYHQLRRALLRQDPADLYSFFDSDLYHPPICKMMAMQPHAAKKFQKRNSSGDWSHIKGSPEEKKKVGYLDREMSKLKKKFTLKDFDLGRVLGKGRFATVYLAREKLKGFIVVLKVIYKSVLAKYQAERALRSEIELQAHLRHPNIVRIFGYFHDTDRIYLILEYAMNGDIFNDVQSCRLDEHTAASYTVQVGRALHYMHRNYVIHRDIKLENVYLNESGQIKVGDFGWSVHTHKLKNDKVVGTLHYMAPEMLTPESNLYDHKVDNWALGILLYEMLCSALPFYGETEEELERKVLRGKLKIPPFVSPEAADLMRRLLQKDPSKRMELDELEGHPWVVKQLRVRSLKYLCLKFVRESSKFFEYDLGRLPVKLRLEIQDDTIYRFYYQ